jgi:transcriptional regulator with GAF, ATPase, and Fis domain
VTIPLIIAGRTWGALTVGTLRQPRTWSPDVVNSLRIVARLLTNVIDRKHREEGVRRSVVGTLHQLRHENTYLRRELEKFSGTATIVGHSTAMRHVLDQVFQVAGTDLSVLITGEPGTGKRLLAARIHEQSPRRDRAMVRLHCASLSPDWIERELLGIEHGPGESRKTGRLEFANGSTVLLDEIGDLPLDAQTNLMRLQEGRLQLPGRSSAVSMDLRLIASTRKDLNDLVARGEFRADLFARLNVFPIHVPALRERREDIPLLVWRFVDEFAEAFNTPVDTIDTESMTALQQYEWRGNARELRNVIERAMIVAPSRHLRIPLPEGDTGSTSSIDNVSIEHITSMLALCGGRVHGKDGAAARLGLSPRALEAKMVTLGLRRP